MKQKYLGKGIQFPVQVNKATGRFIMSEEKKSIRESIYLILMTQKTERFARSGFGSRLMSYAFMDMTNTWFTIMENEIREDILSQEPRITGVNISIDPKMENGCLYVTIDYVITASNTRDNMVFPFYINAAKEQQKA